MQYRRMGKWGLQLSALSFGSWVTFGNQITDSVAEKLMKKAFDSGVNFFDNAEGYAAGDSERVMGKLLKKIKFPRDEYIVSSKVYWGAGGKKPNQTGLSRKHVVEACNDALKRLQQDYLDLYFCHRPDWNTPIEETVWAMNILIQQGKVLYWGTSEWSAQEIMEAHHVAERFNLIGPSMEQPQYNMFHRERFEKEYKMLYSHYGMGTTTWSPLASGILTGKYNNGVPDNVRFAREELGGLKRKIFGADIKEKFAKVEKLKKFAKQYDMTLPQLAIAWCLKNPSVSSVILGASKIDQLEENLSAINYYERISELLTIEIETILQNKPHISMF